MREVIDRVLAERSEVHREVIRLYGPNVADFLDLSGDETAARINERFDGEAMTGGQRAPDLGSASRTTSSESWAMAEPRELLEEFRSGFEAGDDPDPRELLERVEGERRQELRSLIDRYLMTAPRRSWDPVAYEASPAKAAVDRVYESLEGVSVHMARAPAGASQPGADQTQRAGAAPARRAGSGRPGRARRRLLQPDGARLAAGRGRLEPGDRGAGGIVGASAEAIREAGAAGGEAGGPDLLYTRMALSDAAFEAEEVAAPAASSLPPDRDEVDELFTGG